MVTHYFTLQALTKELEILLHGATVTEVFTQQRNELIVSLQLREGQRGVESVNQFLCTSINPNLNYIFVRDKFARAKKNSADLFNGIIGHTVASIGVHRNDRTVECALEGGWMLHVKLYNTAASNILLVDMNNIVREAFKHNKEIAGTLFTTEQKGAGSRPAETAAEFGNALEDNAAQTVFTALKRISPLFGSTYSREVLHRMRCSEETLAGSLQRSERENLFHEIQRAREEINRPLPTIYYRGGEAKILSIIPLQHMSGAQSELFESVNEAVKTFVLKSFHVTSMEAGKKILLRAIKAELGRQRHALELRREGVSGSHRAEEYDYIANIIMANLQHLTKGTKEVELPDIFGDGKNVRVQLDPKLTPARNAEKYFDKARKARSASQEYEKHYGVIASQILLLEKLLLHLDACRTADQVKEFRHIYNRELTKMKLIESTKGEERLPFRVFTVTGGFEVWVGKSSANNDLLTMHYTKPSDLWFHVRGAGGSHTVLKVSKSNVMPSKKAVLEAAGIAAYYSKMRTAGTVPVAYCERKYIRKPKHSMPGAVELEREKVVFVKPGLP